MHTFTVSLTCVMMILSPAVAALAGRIQTDDEME